MSGSSGTTGPPTSAHHHDHLPGERRRGRLRRRARHRLGRVGRPVGLRPRPPYRARFTNPAPRPRRPALPGLGPRLRAPTPTEPYRRRDRPRRRRGDARGRGRRRPAPGSSSGCTMPRDPGTTSAAARHRGRRGPAARSSRSSRSSTTTSTRPGTASSASSPTTRCCSRSGSRPSPWADRAAAPGSRASATPGCPSTSPSRPTTPPRARLRARPRGRRLHRHGARDPARPRRPRLLRDQPGDAPTTRSSTWRSQQKSRPAADELDRYEQEVLAFFDQLLDGESVADERDEGPDPRALRGLARALGADDREARRGRRRADRLGPQPQPRPLAHGARSVWSPSGASSCLRSAEGEGLFLAGRRRLRDRDRHPRVLGDRASSASTPRTASAPRAGRRSRTGPRTSRACTTTRRRRSSCGSGSSSTASPSAPPSG